MCSAQKIMRGEMMSILALLIGANNAKESHKADEPSTGGWIL